jgi:D-amino-acid oxidase
MRVLVLGAGVSGLSSSLRLLQAGHDVRIWARDAPAATTSATAAAIWYPYLAAPADRVLAWAIVTLRELERLSAIRGTGVTMRDGLEVFREPAPDPWWAPAVPGFRHASTAELPAGYRDGYALRLPVADMSIYLDWLQQEILRLGGRLMYRTVKRLDEVKNSAHVVVNCTGLGARELVADSSLYGARGQVSVVDAPTVSRFIFEEDTLTYVIPRVASVVIGGTLEERVEDVTVDEAVTASIRSRCVALVPALASARVVAERAGIRPCRPTVRVEREVIDGLPIVHNYGHGGSGVTASWGCADEVAQLVAATAARP